ncbi:LacI family DNA-binding transcriptional regulator [Spiractinospora alimapuensis]|uniref:LacI family DNA-binding transcriptional regulator n=1 Tax=Spiractinospora alimapuensis TaxID=2820884 RepID=UPI001F16A6A5|nr:LacI family DNA-binding transcriptional regulator [Spiractinospora alimapuensis]QVQ54461.1 LacI family DNA-binding transcriptional regulator [Spiractinospora alimapuensis]
MNDGDPSAARTRRPTMVDVAAAARVSVKTVSRVANGVPTVDPELASRVVDAMRTLGFQRNSVAASLRSGQSTATIGLIIIDLANTFYSTIAAAVAEVAREHGRQLFTASSGWDDQQERDLALDLCRRRVDGLIVVPSGADLAYLAPEIERGTPVVFVDRPPVGLDGDTILIDNRGGARNAVRMLVTEGHRSIGVITDALNAPTMRERRAGARDELMAHAILSGSHLVEIASDDPATARRATATMLDLPEPPTAIFCGNNRVLSGAVAEVVARGENVRLAGFDDVEFAELLPYPVTVVGYDTPSLGRFAAQALFRRIQDPATTLSTTTIATYLADRGITHTARSA